MDLSPARLLRNNDVNPSQRMWEQCSNLTKWAISAIRISEKSGVLIFSLQQVEHSVSRGGRVGGVGSGQQHAALLAQINLPCCCCGNLS